MKLVNRQLATHLFVWSFTLSVLMNPVVCGNDDDDADDDDPNGDNNSEEDVDEEMTVCQEEDNDLRVTCPLRPEPNYHTYYEFSMTRGSKEIIINTNVSGTMPEHGFRHNTYVEDLQPYGFRLIMLSFTLKENTTFMCKVDKEKKMLFVNIDDLETCSAISLFLLSSPFLLHLLLPLGTLQLLEVL